MNKKLIIIIAAVALICAGGAGAAVWYFAAPKADASESDHKEEKSKKKKKKEEDEDAGKPLKYLTVDKVIVMLRRGPNEATPHYLSADLVVATLVEKEKEAKEHLPLLRSVAVRTLSALPMDKAQAMTIDEFAAALNTAFEEEYEKDDRERPFKEVMIGKLIIE